MRQCSAPEMFGGSRPKRALTIRATCPAGTIGIAGTTAAAAGGAACSVGPCGGGSETGRLGGASSSGLGFGASTPDWPPGGMKLWPPPTCPGGRGTESKPGGIVVCCATACDAVTANAKAAAQSRRRPCGPVRRAVMHPVYRPKSGEFKPSRLLYVALVQGLAPCYAQRTELRMPEEALDLLKTRRSVKPIELIGPGPAPAELDTL